jgi:hypothetical protein
MKLRPLNLALRVVMEVGIVVALAQWGFRAGRTTGMKFFLGVGAPVLGFGFWGLVDFRQAGRMSEPLRLMQELVVSGVAAVAWYVAGQHTLGIALGLLSLVYHGMVYVSGDTLLKR